MARGDQIQLNLIPYQLLPIIFSAIVQLNNKIVIGKMYWTVAGQCFSFFITLNCVYFLFSFK